MKRFEATSRGVVLICNNCGHREVDEHVRTYQDRSNNFRIADMNSQIYLDRILRTQCTRCLH